MSVAARLMGVKVSTLKSWRRRAGLVASGSEPSGPVGTDLEQLEARARRSWIVASEALEKASRAVKLNKPVNARNLAVTLGVLVDKAMVIETAVQMQQDRQLRLSEATGQQLAAIVSLFLQAVGVPVTPAVRSLLRELLEQAGKGGPLAPSPALSQPAYAEVRGAFEERLRGDFLAELEEERRERDVLTLPAPTEELEEPDLVDPPGPEAAPAEPIQEVDVVYDDEVPGPFREAYGDERLARSAWEAHKQRQTAIARRDAEQGRLPAWRSSTWKDVHSVFGPNSSMRNPGGHV